jgi:ABC-type dipeptide/oligopeptide/nickel transport system permease subunit
MLIGSRVSISIGVVAVLISNCGNLFGARRVFWRKVDALIMWLVIIWSIPTLLCYCYHIGIRQRFWQVLLLWD